MAAVFVRHTDDIKKPAIKTLLGCLLGEVTRPARVG